MAECLRTRVRFPPSPPNNQTTLAVVFLFVDLVLSLSRYGFKKLPGAVVAHGCGVYEPKDGTFNVCFLHDPEGFCMDVDGRATQERLPR